MRQLKILLALDSSYTKMRSIAIHKITLDATSLEGFIQGSASTQHLDLDQELDSLFLRLHPDLWILLSIVIEVEVEVVEMAIKDRAEPGIFNE